MLNFNYASHQYARRSPMAYPYRVLCDHLVDQNLIPLDAAKRAADIARRQGVPVADVLEAAFGLSAYSISQTIAQDWHTQLINPLLSPPDTSLPARYGPPHCLQDRLLPWRQMGGHTVVLATRPEHFLRQRDRLEQCFGPVRMAITTEQQLNRSVTALFDEALVKRAETRVPASESCRTWRSGFALSVGLVLLGIIVATAILAPRPVFALLTGWAILTLICSTALKAAAAVIGHRHRPKTDLRATPARLPVITMLVPLYNETAIAEHLLARLKALDYPRELLDVCLILEADDPTTRETLGRTTLPTWMRAIVVPKGTVKTKPRALNYALDFARGSIVGVWDAEDAPAPDQLHVVARQFANTGPDVACLQGTLDYYNAATNWLTRCFTIEYAGWFRVLLPGLQRMGLVVPLGGTTLFFRGEALEALGGWDAHNVTEDADLGVRLARHGYQTQFIPTVTEEEANGRAWPWVKQRSRWLKGYAITYGVHMRHPARLWRDLGAWRFFGLQVLFLGTLSQFVLAPILWSFLLLPFGFDHPLSAWLPSWAFWSFAGLFVTSELVGFTVAAIGLRKAGKPWLIKWALTLQVYFPLGAIAAYKGLVELATKPFYWDKTAHGVLLPKGRHMAATPPPPPPPRQVSGG